MSQVVIGDILPRTQVTAAGGQTVFSTNWTANYESDVVVFKRSSSAPADDAIQKLNYPADFSVVFVGSQQDVQVTLVNPATLGDIVTIIRDTPADRENLYTNTNFTPSMLNNDFGILTLVDQQAELVNQLVAPRYNYSAEIIAPKDTILPILEASQIWAKDSGDTAFIAVDIPTSGFPPKDAEYVTMTADSELPNAYPLDTVGTGIMVNSPGTNAILSRVITGTPDQITVTNGDGASGNIGVSIPNNPIFPGNGGAGIPAGTTAQRPVIGSNVPLRFNSDIGALEYGNPSSSQWNTLNDEVEVNPGAQNELAYYAAAGSLLSGLPTANNGVLVTDGTGEPSISSTLPSAVQQNITELGQQSQAIDMGGHQITNGIAPTNPNDFATKAYVDTQALASMSVLAATTAPLTVTQSGAGIGATLTNAGAQAAFSIDGETPTIGQNVLIKDQAIDTQNGVYTVTDEGSGATNWVLTRSQGYDTPSDINDIGLILVKDGTTNSGTAWFNTVHMLVVDTTPIVYAQFSATISLPLSMSDGGTGASLTPSNGGIIYSGATTMGVLSGTTTPNQVLLSDNADAPSWSDATYPSSVVAGSIIYASSNDVIGELTPGAGVIDALQEDVNEQDGLATTAITGTVGGFRKNFIIGGNFTTNPWQRGVTFTGVVAAGYYADRFRYTLGFGTAVVNIGKISDAPTVAQAGMLTVHSLGVEVTTADTTIPASTFYTIRNILEGYNWGQIAQRAFTLSFWVKSTKTGIFTVSFSNDVDRTFVAEYEVLASDTWEKKVITVSPSPSSGTWNYVNSNSGLAIYWILASGTGLDTSSLLTWNSDTFRVSTNQVNGVDAVSNVFRLALVQLELGEVATDFEVRSFEEELSLCQRYYQKSYPVTTAPGTTSTLGCECYYTARAAANATGHLVKFQTSMRATPTIELTNTVASGGVTWRNISAGANSGAAAVFAGTAGQNAVFITNAQAAGDAVGNVIAINYTADAELT